MLAKSLFDQPRHKVCLSLSTKDRVSQTLEAIGALAFEGAFDLLWLDGSATDEGRQLPDTLAPSLQCLREIHREVIGGPDFAIFTALARMLALGYPMCGLLESDVKLAPGWFDRLMGLFDAGAADGLTVGAVTALTFNKRVLFRRPSYAVTLISGAAMILFTREAAQLIVDHYRTTTNSDIRSWLLYAADRDLATIGEGAGTGPFTQDTRVASDLVYETVLQQHGLCVLGALPAHARSLDDETLLGPVLGGYGTPPSADQVAADASAFTAFAATLRRRRPGGPDAGAAGSPYLLFRSLPAWVVFAHQLAFMRDGPVRFNGRWRIVWSKFTGPFAFEADEPGASISFPLHGALKGLFSARTADSGVVEFVQDGVALARFDALAGQPATEQYLATLDLEPRGAGLVTLRLAAPADGRAGTRFRLSALCFSEPQPWLPPVPQLDVEAMARRLEEQATQGFVAF
ncbi:MAG: hypothetical protein JO021_07310 [Alphaproteobacteria bacterium]|nr:hypothetical protein [Alphaproteobacteria bacterium]